MIPNPLVPHDERQRRDYTLPGPGERQKVRPIMGGGGGGGVTLVPTQYALCKSTDTATNFLGVTGPVMHETGSGDEHQLFISFNGPKDGNLSRGVLAVFMQIGEIVTTNDSGSDGQTNGEFFIDWVTESFDPSTLTWATRPTMYNTFPSEHFAVTGDLADGNAATFTPGGTCYIPAGGFRNTNVTAYGIRIRAVASGPGGSGEKVECDAISAVRLIL